MAPNKGKQKVEEVDTGILDDIPTPITTFDMRKPKKFAKRYKKRVEEIRAAMEKDTTVKFTFVMVGGNEVVVPVTPPDDKTRQGTYVIRLTDGTKNLDLVADKYQSWFRGIVTSGRQRYEVDEKLPKIMKKSMSLYTSGIYPKLIDCDLPELEVGYQQFLNAFHTAGYKGDAKDSKKVKEAIAILLIMFFEGPRLLPVEEWIEDLLRWCSSGEAGKKFEKLISDWCDDSLKFYEDVAGASKVVISDDASDVARNAAGVLRIMCRSQWEKWVEEQQIMKKQGQGQAGSKEKSKKQEARVAARSEGKSR